MNIAKNVSLIYGQKKDFFELKKVLLIQKKILRSNKIDLFALKNNFLNQQNFLQFKELFSLIVYQRNVSLIQRNCFLGKILATREKHSRKIAKQLAQNENVQIFLAFYQLLNIFIPFY